MFTLDDNLTNKIGPF